ncbi:uncharacterized protein CBL_10022 [Carabus blaptoides fortunei]
MRLIHIGEQSAQDISQASVNNDLVASSSLNSVESIDFNQVIRDVKSIPSMCSSDLKSQISILEQYNEEKTLMWLQKKTERVADILKQKNIHVGGGAVSATFVKSSKSDHTDESYVRYAHGIVSEYLMDDLSQKLLKQLGLPEESALPNLAAKRKSTSIVTPPEVKKIKTDSEPDALKNGALDLSGKPDIKPKLMSITSKEKARAKVASGSKSISSFFKKK